MAKILLVEDDSNLREIFEMRLQAEGYQTVSANDGENAIVVAMKEKPDLIIADVMMPRMSGFEMLENIRSTPEIAQTKVIMMTALGQAEDQARGAKLGVVKYLVKSQVTLEDFARVVSEVLGPAKADSGTTADQQGDSSTTGTLVNNNQAESEKTMDPTTPTNPAGPAPAADNGASNPMGSDPMSSMPAAGAQSAADEQSAVQSQVDNFAASMPAAPAGGDPTAAPASNPMGDAPAVPADPAAPTMPTDPAAPGSDPTVPPAAGSPL